MEFNIIWVSGSGFKGLSNSDGDGAYISRFALVFKIKCYIPQERECTGGSILYKCREVKQLLSQWKFRSCPVDVCCYLLNFAVLISVTLTIYLSTATHISVKTLYGAKGQSEVFAWLICKVGRERLRSCTYKKQWGLFDVSLNVLGLDHFVSTKRVKGLRILSTNS